MTVASQRTKGHPALRAGRVAWRAGLVVAVLAYLLGVARTAWLGDDAYITLRVVENLANGHGLRWNTTDRVLVSTHPLWLLMLGALRPLTGEVYFTTIFLSIGLSLAALWAVVRCAVTLPAAVAAVTVLLSSRAYVEYSTSGLENALAHALLAAFVVVAQPPRPSPGALLRLSALGSLLMCTRHDLFLVVAPVVLLALWRQRSWRSLMAVLAGATPLLAWLIFATLYFGSPLPMPSHAKLLATGVPLREMLAQGSIYVWATFKEDPLTIVGVVAGIVAGLWRAPSRPLALGALLYVAYILRIGGDFMLGRFFTVPLLAGVLCGTRVLQAALQARLRAGGPAILVIVVAVGLQFVSTRPPLLSRPTDPGQGAVARGIGDERGAYYPSLGLLSPGRSIPVASVATSMLRAAGKPEPEVLIAAAVGVVGFVAGPGYYLVDPVICDPLICRLPSIEPENWRVGHLSRRVPDGYLLSVFHGDNRLRHPSLAAYYDRLLLLTRGDLLSADRLRAIWGFARGQYDHLLRAYADSDYRAPQPVQVKLTELQPTREQAPWHAAGNVTVGDGGVEVDLGGVSHATSLQVGLHSQGSYVLEFRRGHEVLDTTRVITNLGMRYGMSTYPAAVPGAVAAAGFDRIVVRLDLAASVDQVGALGHIGF